MAGGGKHKGTVETAIGKELMLIGLVAVERLSQLSTIDLEVISRGGPVDLHKALARPVRAKVQGLPFETREFNGVLTEYAEEGRLEDSQDFVYRLVLRPPQYMLSLNRDHRIHHKKTMKDILGLLGSKSDIKLQENYPALEYRVQYDESDFDFVARHMEREGIYYFFDHSGGDCRMVMVDAAAGHPALQPAKVRLESGAVGQAEEPLLWGMREHRRFATTTYNVDDYDYTAPTVSLKKQRAQANLGKGATRFAASAPAEVGGTIAERHEWPGNFANATATMGERYARVRLEADRADMARSYVQGNLFAAAVGRKLSVAFDESGGGHNFIKGADYVIVGTRHSYASSGYRSDGTDERLHVELELMPVGHPFRPPQATPMPRIRGPQTAIVVGPAGEEIHTDKYGRVKLFFLWDGRAPRNAAHERGIWVRVGQISAGKGFGAFMVPRIGHEVIVEFLNGDPDRPIVTGSVYNEGNLPAFGTASGNPVQGIRTNSSKGGGGFNEIRLDDTKNSEVFSVQAQKDLKTLVLKGHETRDIKEGNRTTTIDKGDETLTVKQGKRTTTIQGNETLTVKQGNRSAEISMGNDTLTIKQGNRATTLDMGNDTLTLKMGNQTTRLNLGKQATEALQSIEFKVGQSSIRIDQMGVTIKGMMIKIEAQMMYQTKGLMMQQQASAIHIVKGGLVMIN